MREVGGEYSPPLHLTDEEKYGTSRSSKGSMGSSWGSHGVETGRTSPVATPLVGFSNDYTFSGLLNEPFVSIVTCSFLL